MPETPGIDIAAVLAFIADNEPLGATLMRFSPNDHAALRATLRRAHLGPQAKPASPPPTPSAPPSQRVPAQATQPAPTTQPASSPDGTFQAKPQAERMIVYSDGASRGNPGLSGAGWVICIQGKIIAKGAMFLGHRTNNEAEYLAAAMGIQAACDLGAKEVVLRADSELMVRQLQGRYKVKNAKLQPLFNQINVLRRTLRAFYAEHVPREQNSAADAQANLAIDER